MAADNVNAAYQPTAEGGGAPQENLKGAYRTTAGAPDAQPAGQNLKGAYTRSATDQGDAYKVQTTEETNGGHSPDVNRDHTLIGDFDPNHAEEDGLQGADLDQRVLNATAQHGVGPMDEGEVGAGTIGSGTKVPAGGDGVLGGPVPGSTSGRGA